MVTFDEVIVSIKDQIRDPEHHSRLRVLYDRIENARLKSGAAGMSTELQTEWDSLRTEFISAITKFKADAGLS